jgi:hypothetical protein
MGMGAAFGTLEMEEPAAGLTAREEPPMGMGLAGG